VHLLTLVQMVSAIFPGSDKGAMSCDLIIGMCLNLYQVATSFKTCINALQEVLIDHILHAYA